MDPTWAILGPISGQLSRQSIKRLLGVDPAIRLVAVEGWADTLDRIKRQSPAFHVLIADFATPDAPPVDVLLARYPRLAIAAINLRGFDAHLHNIDSRLFVTFIGAMGRGAEIGGQPALIGPPVGRAVLRYATARDAIPDLCEWLDAVLSRALARCAETADTRDIGGLSMAVDTARALLGAGNAGLDVDALGRVAEDAEARLLKRMGEVADRDCPLQAIVRSFDLDAAERRLFWLALAPEIANRYARVIGVANDDMSRRRATLGVAASALAERGGEAGCEWQLAARLFGTRPFARYALVGPDAAERGMPLSQAALTVPRDLVEYVLTGKPAATDDLIRVAA